MSRWFRRQSETARDAGPGFGAPSGGEPAWWHVMGYEAGPPRSLGQVEQRFRRLAAAAHPDRGGEPEDFHRLLRARAQARRQLTP